MAESCSEYKKDIDDLYNKTTKIEMKMVEIDTNQKHYTETLEKVVESNEKLSDTLQSMQITFTKMDGKMDDISRDIAETKTQVGGIDNRMKKIEEDNSFGILAFVKKYLPWIIVGVGVLVYWGSQYIKF